MIAPHGPFKVELKIAITNDENEGVVTYVLSPGVIPTADSLAEALREASNMPELAGGDFRLMGRHEFVQSLFDEKTGGAMNFAIPGPDEFDMASAVSESTNASQANVLNQNEPNP